MRLPADKPTKRPRVMPSGGSSGHNSGTRTVVKGTTARMSKKTTPGDHNPNNRTKRVACKQNVLDGSGSGLGLSLLDSLMTHTPSHIGTATVAVVNGRIVRGVYRRSGRLAV